MHIIGFLRGQDDKVFRLMQDMQGVHFNFRVKLPYNFETEELAKDFLEKNKDNIEKGEIIKSYTGHWCITGIKGIQMGVRPYVPIDFVFPKEYKDQVIAMLRPTNCWNDKFDWCISILRKLIGLEEVPKYSHPIELATPMRQLNFVDFTVLGIK